MIIIKKNRIKLIGARFTAEEKKDIEKIADLTDTSLSDLLRDAIFSHINFIKESRGDIEKLELFIIREVD